VRDPDNGMLLPEDAAVEVPDSIFWRRRLRDGDITRVQQSTEKTKGEKS
jgi:hypothetical protein